LGERARRGDLEVSRERKGVGRRRVKGAEECGRGGEDTRAE
jgi:hypothetical protein